MGEVGQKIQTFSYKMLKFWDIKYSPVTVSNYTVLKFESFQDIDLKMLTTHRHINTYNVTMRSNEHDN